MRQQTLNYTLFELPALLLVVRVPTYPVPSLYSCLGIELAQYTIGITGINKLKRVAVGNELDYGVILDIAFT